MRTRPERHPAEDLLAIRDKILADAMANNPIDGGPGDDLIIGTAGPDSICGEGGNDIVMAGGGNDYVDGCPGDDTLYGGAGRDVFQFYDFITKPSRDTIADWQDGKDILELTGTNADAVNVSGSGRVHVVTIDGAPDFSVTIIGKGFDYNDILFT